MVCPGSDFDSDSTDKTMVLNGNQETLSRELKRAKEQDACLIIIRGTPQGHRYFIFQNEMTIGRDAAADISISDSAISRKHGKVIKQDGKVLFMDLGSSNGTVINGKKLQPNESVMLAKEDMIKMGGTILKYLPAGELEILFYGSLGSAAHTDPLTRIYNKGYLTEALEAEFKRAKALGNEFSILFFDIDHFKKINDTHGHDAGDQVLKEFTALIRSRFTRPKDVFARYGGEEFVLLLANTPAAEAGEIAEKVRAEIQSHTFLYDGKPIPVTSSVGVAALDHAMESSHTLLKAADKALYASKQGGRNRVTVHQS